MINWFDGHLDLGSLAVEGRDLSLPLDCTQATDQSLLPAAITFPSLTEGYIQATLGTIFTAPDIAGPCGYPQSDSVAAAYTTGLLQLDCYRKWEKSKLICLIKNKTELQTYVGIYDSIPQTTNSTSQNKPPICVILLMEGADPIRNPDDAKLWYDYGLRVAGMSWAKGTRYAGGNESLGPLTVVGRELVAAFDDLSIIHDLSHLSDEAAWQVLEVSSQPVVATHSNSRTVLAGTTTNKSKIDTLNKNQRHLTDDLIKAIAQRDGIIGLNLYRKFISLDNANNVSIEQAVDHVEYIAQLMGHKKGVALGSDMDGGFSADDLPDDIKKPVDLRLIAESLSYRGWSNQEIADFAFNNWYRFLLKNLPD